MTDVLAILEEESRSLRRRERWIKGFCLFVAVLTTITTLSAYFRERSVGDAVGSLVPLIGLGGVAAAYSPRHRKALQDAIDEPDPMLDLHFARALNAEEADIARLAREAFAARFRDRGPSLDEDGWAAAARSLPSSTTEQAEAMLRHLRTAAPGEAIKPLEAFAGATEVERLRTGALQALGDIRLRTARERIQSASSLAGDQAKEERTRLGLSSGTL